MTNTVLSSGNLDHELEIIIRQDQKVRRQGVTLPEALFALKPLAWDTIEHHRSLTRGIDAFDPSSLLLRETLSLENIIQCSPADRVEGFAEIQLEDNGGSFLFVAELD